MFCFNIVMLNAAQTWKEFAQEFTQTTNENSVLLESYFRSLGINIKIYSSYTSDPNELVMDLRTGTEKLWKELTKKDSMVVIKSTMLQQYRQYYRTDEEFRKSIETMKSSNGQFRIIISYLKNNSLKTKDISITPDEIMR